MICKQETQESRWCNSVRVKSLRTRNLMAKGKREVERVLPSVDWIR